MDLFRLQVAFSVRKSPAPLRCWGARPTPEHISGSGESSKPPSSAAIRGTTPHREAHTMASYCWLDTKNKAKACKSQAIRRRRSLCDDLHLLPELFQFSHHLKCARMRPREPSAPWNHPPEPLCPSRSSRAQPPAPAVPKACRTESDMALTLSCPSIP